MEEEKKVPKYKNVYEAPYEDITIEHIIDYCKENDKVTWLKNKAAEKVDYKVYPRVKKVNENGKTVSVADKTQEPTIKKEKISFIQIKKAFCEEFMPEKLPDKKKKPTMYELIENL